jgi:hypothetical protein
VFGGVTVASTGSAKNSCRVATTGALTVTYANGASGVGATLTNAGAQAALSIDGVTLATSDRVLVKDQASQLQNGLYSVTSVGSGASNWVLTRTTDCDTTDKLTRGTFVVVTNGGLAARTLWMQTVNGPITIGTTGTAWFQSTIEAASNSVAGKARLATTGEVSAGANSGITVSPATLAGSIFGTFVAQIICSDPNGAALTTGNGKGYFIVPSVCAGMDLVGIALHVTTVSSSGLPTFQLHNVTDAVNMLSTLVSVDVSEKDSSTAATPPIIGAGVDDVTTGDELRCDCTIAGTGTKGAVITLYFRLP